MPFPITGFYISLTIFLAIILGMRIGFLRAHRGISILHDGDMEIATRMRVHGNMVETAALVMLAMAIIELNGASPAFLHSLGMTYITARILHAVGLRHDNIRHPFRAIGAMASMLVMLSAGACALLQTATAIF